MLVFDVLKPRLRAFLAERELGSLAVHGGCSRQNRWPVWDSGPVAILRARWTPQSRSRRERRA